MKQQRRWVAVSLASLMLILFQFGGQSTQAATPMESGETLTGELSVAEADTYQFHGVAGDRILLDADVVSGVHGFNTEIVLIDPDFLDETDTKPGGDFLGHYLQKTGLYTIMVQDVDRDHTGTYKLTLLNLTRGPMTSAGDSDGGPMASGETLSGTLAVSDMDGFQFHGEAGDRVLIDADVVSGVHGFDTEIVLVAPDFTTEIDTLAGGDLLDHELAQTGEYTIIVQDVSLDHTGAYKITLLNLTRGPMTSAGDSDGGPMASGETLSGTLAVSDMDGFQFHGEAGDRVLIDADVVSGVHGFDTEIVLVAPDFTTEIDTLVGGDLLDHELAQTGEYTIIVQDVGLDHTGTYKVTLLNLTRGPMTSAGDSDGGPMASGETLSGTLAVSDMDGFQFHGEAGDRVLIDADVVSGVHGFDTEIVLVAPDFTTEIDTLAGGDLLDHELAQTGEYTIIVKDVSLDHTGTYKITLLKPPCALSSPSDCDGGLIALSETLSGALSVSDMDGFQFYGEAGDRALIDADVVSGVHGFNTEIVLIDPDFFDETDTKPGGDFLDHFLQKTGLYTIVVQDVDLDHTGTYNVTLNKLPDAVRPGIYNHSPSLNACDQSTDMTLTWDPVTDATGYDVFFGTEVLAPLVQVGVNIPNPSWSVTNLEQGTVYYWKVVAHTPAGEIQGVVNWFVTQLMCDLNQDCSCNILDWPFFIEDWGSTNCNEPGVDCECDLNQDGSCNILDWPFFIKNWGITICP